MPEINATTADWLDVYDASGIATGTPIGIQNKSSVHVLVQESALDPGAGNDDGLILQYAEEVYLDGDQLAWVKCNSSRGLRVFVWEQ